MEGGPRPPLSSRRGDDDGRPEVAGISDQINAWRIGGDLRPLISSRQGDQVLSGDLQGRDRRSGDSREESWNEKNACKASGGSRSPGSSPSSRLDDGNDKPRQVGCSGQFLGVGGDVSIPDCISEEGRRSCFLQGNREGLEFAGGVHGVVNADSCYPLSSGCFPMCTESSSKKQVNNHKDGCGGNFIKQLDSMNKLGNAWANPLPKEVFMGADHVSKAPSSVSNPGKFNFNARNNSFNDAGCSKTNPEDAGRQPWKAWVKLEPVKLPARGKNEREAVLNDRVQLDVEEVDATSKKFESALVGRLFGRRLNFRFLDAELHKRWNNFGRFRLVTLSGDCFICFFDNMSSRDAVILGGPWFVAGQVVGVDCWTPSFSPKSMAGLITPVWLRLPDLPMYCWGVKNIVRIAGLLGEPIYMDSATANFERGFYARVCVKLNLSQPLKPGMWIDGPHGSFYQNVEYEGFSEFCVSCGHVGHMVDGCKVNQMADERAEFGADRQSQMRARDSSERMQEDGKDDVAQVMAEAQAVKDALNYDLGTTQMKGTDGLNPPSGFGPWMIVDRKKKYGNVGIQNNNRKGGGGKNISWVGNQAKNGFGKAGMGSWKTRKDQIGKERLAGIGVCLNNKGKDLNEKIEDRGGRKPVATFHDRDSRRPETTLHDQGIASSEVVLHDQGDRGSEPASCQKSVAVLVPSSESSIIQYNEKNKTQMSSVERAVSGLGPVTTSGTRQRKRRHVTIDDGGDASPLVG